IGHPEKAPRRVVDERKSPADILPHPVERWARHVTRPSTQQPQLPIGTSKQGHRSFMQELRRRTLELAIRSLQPDETARARALVALFDLVHLPATQSRPS